MTLLEPATLGIELLDDPTAGAERVRESLRHIARANRWFGGSAAVRFGLNLALPVRSDRPLTLLDIGTGMGDLPLMAVRHAARRGLVLRPIGLERHGAAARLAHDNGLATVIGDGGALPFRSGAIDIVLVSQVAHHFAPEAIVRLLAECRRVAGRAVIVSDLRRSGAAMFGFRVGATLFGFDADTVRDGVTSLQRGFSAESLRRLLERAGVGATVTRRPGARLVAVWRREA